MATIYEFMSYTDTYIPSNTVTALQTQSTLAYWNTKLNAGAKLESAVGNGTIRSSFLAPDYSSLTLITSGGSVVYKNLTLLADKSFSIKGYTVTSSDGASSWEVIGDINVSPTYVISGTLTSAKYSSSINTANPQTWMFQGSVIQSGTLVQGYIDKFVYTYKYLGYSGVQNSSFSNAYIGADYVNGGVILSTSTLVTGLNFSEVDASGKIVLQVRVDGMPVVTANTTNLWGLIFAGNDTFIMSGDGNQVSVSGQGGNDTFIGDAGINYFRELVDSSGVERGVGNDTIDGGASYDYVLYGSNKSIAAYGFSNYDSATNAVTVNDYSTSNNSGVDRLINIEEIQFSDESLTWTELTSLISTGAKLGSSFGILRSGDSTDDALGGTVRSDVILGNAGKDTISGSDGNDTITGGAGNDVIDGGAGTDTATFSGNRASYTVSKTSTGWAVSSTAEGVDTLTNVERLKFADTAVAYDTSGVGGQTYRVYKAAFNRTPDLGGLGFWISGMDGGVSLNAVAQGFVNSAEFKTVYGSSPTNAQIVTRFYDNVLGRAADSGGYNYWLGILDSGQASVAGVLASFSESSENQAAVIGVIENGILYTPYG